jgi:hypothetical protein
MKDDIEKFGFAIVAGVLSVNQQQELLSVLGSNLAAGRRGLLGEPSIAELSRSEQILRLVRPHLSSEPFPVRALYFNKSLETNWPVAWHQDVTLAVRERVDVPNFGPWSVKGGIPHVQPPVALLEKMISVRLHLDDADESNGALRVLPGTHSRRRLSVAEIEKLRSELGEVMCVAKAGDAMLMRPLLLHASSRSTSAQSRRIVHIEYAAFALPCELEWHDAA